MEHILHNSIVIFLDANINSLRIRLGDFRKRGIVFPEGMNLLDLYNSRITLYKKYADIVLDTSFLNIENTMSEILNILNTTK